ncbi:MAG: Gfo/Idh/MocA family oxidoreductase [Alphaproteobacteria bacterium]|nr:Gfo/Idh/MocA family oxidoreductase [Alphaproteobacteria bacterium]
MTGKFNVAIVGLGMAASPHVKSLKDLSDIVNVAGVYSRNEASRVAFGKLHNLPVAESYESLLADEALDAVIILTPPNARKELVAQAAAAGKHIFMEKPVERSSVAALELVEICEAARVKLGITFQFRFREAALKLKSLIQSGEMGALASVMLSVPWWRSGEYYQEPGRGTFEQDGGGVLITQAVHSLDLMLSLTGRAAEVQAMAGTSILHDIEVEDFVGAGVRFAGGAIGSIMATTTTYPGQSEYLTLNCMNATATLKGSILSVDWHDGRSETFGKEAGTGGGDDRMAFPHEWHRAQIEDFINAVQNDREPISNGRSALQVHYLIDALLASARDGVLTKVAH